MEDNKSRLDEETMDEINGGQKVDPNSSCPMGGAHEWKKVVRFNTNLGVGFTSYVCKKCNGTASSKP